MINKIRTSKSVTKTAGGKEFNKIMKAIGILWNSMNQHIDDALIDIKKYATIDEILFIDFDNEFSKFVSLIYPYTGENLWKLEYKLKHMEKYDSKKIIIIFLDVDNNKKIFVERKEIFIYEQVEKLKSFIRNKYKNIINGYAFDNVFHMTDDEEEYIDTKYLLINFLIDYYSKSNNIIDLDSLLSIKSDYNYLDKNFRNGKRNKFTFCDEELMFKEQKNDTYEAKTEKFCYELFKELNVDVAEYYLARYNNKLGVLTRNFVKETDLFYNGSTIINAYLNYLETGLLTFNTPIKYNIETIMKYNNIEELSKIFYTLSKVTSFDMNSIVSDLKKAFALDMILLQSDRNSNNWGIIYNKKTNNTKFAPMYDNSNIFLLNTPNIINKLELLLKTDELIFMNYFYNNSITLLAENKDKNLFTPKNQLIYEIEDEEILKYLEQYINKIKNIDLDMIINKIKISENDDIEFYNVLITAINDNVYYINEVLENKKKLVKR